MNIEILDQPPSFNAIAMLSIEVLAPLSMVVQMPGKFYRSQPEPSRGMLYGLLENALGWHIGVRDRAEIIKQLMKRHKIKEIVDETGVGFKSLLQFHVRFGFSIRESPNTMLRYNDYWSQQLRTGGLEFFGGSREYDKRLVSLVNAATEKKVTLTDSAGIRDENVIDNFNEGDKINLSVVRPYFPRYYVTPTPREYVVPQFAYQYRVETSKTIAVLLSQALEDPAAPLYLGSSDGWVEATWQTLSEITP